MVKLLEIVPFFIDIPYVVKPVVFPNKATCTTLLLFTPDVGLIEHVSSLPVESIDVVTSSLDPAAPIYSELGATNECMGVNSIVPDVPLVAKFNNNVNNT